MNDQSVAGYEIPVTQRMQLMGQAQAQLARDPRNADAMLVMAAVTGIEDSVDKAIGWLQKAHAIRKKDPDILRRLVAASVAARDFRLTRKYGRKLSELQPRNVEIQRLVGDAYRRAGLVNQAVQAYRAACRLAPGHSDIWVNLGSALGDSGDHEAGRQCYQKALELDPFNARALYQLGFSKKHSLEEARRHVEAAVRATRSCSEDDKRAQLYFSAGKVLDDASQFDEAFDYFARANAVKAPTLKESLKLPFDNSREAFTRTFASLRKDFGIRSNEPVFIVGMPRSGTTLTESICGAHSKMTAGDEMDMIGSICVALGRDSDIPGLYRRKIEELPRAGVAEMAQDYLRRARAVAGKTERFTDKMPHNFLNIGMILLLFPEAKIIHLRRHPMDNCFSIYSNSMLDFHNKYKTDLQTLGLYYIQYTKLMEHWKGVFPGKIHDVYYEDLVTNTELNARNIIDYLGLDWEDGVMDHTRSQRSVKTLSNWQVRQPVYSTSKGRWRNYEKHLEPLRSVLNEAVARYEAELDAISSNA